MRTTSLLARVTLIAVAGGLPAGIARGAPPKAADEPKEVVLDTETTMGLLEPPVPRAIPFGSEMPAGARIPPALGTLKYAIFRVGEPQGALEGFLLGWKDLGKDAARDSLYVDPDADGDLANGGNGDLDLTSDMRTRRATLPLKRPAGDPDNVTLVPWIFVRRAAPGAEEPWHVFPAGRRTTEMEIDGKTYAVALVDFDGDGSIVEGKDVLWFDANADGIFDPDPAARERLAIPAVVKAGPRLFKLSVPFPSGLKVKAVPLASGEPQAGLPAQTPTLLSWRLSYASASQTAVDERVAAIVGARTLTEDATWAWLDKLIDASLESPVRAACLDGLANPAFGADRSSARLKEIVKRSADVSVRSRAITLLGGHPGSGAANELKVLVENRDRPMNERINAMRALAKFPDSLDVVKRHMNGSDPPELKAAAYDGLAERTPDDVHLHKQALELGSPAARGQAIAALGRLGDPQGLALARREFAAKQAQVRGGAVRVLVQSGKRNDLVAAVEAAQDDAPIERFTDFDRNGRWDKGEPFVDGNGNGIFDPDAGVRRALKDSLRGERGRPEILKFVMESMLGHKEDWARDVAVEVLADLDDAAARTALFKRAYPEPVRDTKIKILGAAGKAKQNLPIDDFVKIADHKDEAIRAAASAALVEAAPEDPRVRALVKQLLERPKGWTDQVQGCEAAGQGGMVEAIPGVLKCLESGGTGGRWSVKVAAVEALYRLHPREAFEPLLAAMKTAGERSRLSLAIRKVLFRLTGMELPDDPDQWRSWAAGHPDWQVPVDPPVATTHGRRTVSAPDFFGVAVESKRIVLVIDHSNSMLIPDSSGERIRSRWEILIEQTNNLIGKLTAKDTLFNIVFFSQDVTVFRPKSIEATEDSRNAAKKFVASIKPEGETNVWKGLKIALDEPDVDTIVLLTDGEPSTGEFTRGSDIIREVSYLNRFRRVVISTVSMGQDSAFLRELAAKNHGTYVRK